MITAVLLGTIGVTFGTGLAMSLHAIQDSLDRKSPGAVVVQAYGPPPPPVPGVNSRPPRKIEANEISRLIGAQPGTRRFFMTGQTELVSPDWPGRPTSSPTPATDLGLIPDDRRPLV